MFSETNDLPDISPCILWGEAKAQMQGKVISYKKKREREST